MNSSLGSISSHANIFSLNHLAAVRLVEPAPAAVIATEPNLVAEPSLAAIAVAKRSNPLPTLHPSVTARLEHVRWINPVLAAGIATLRSTVDGVPRNQIAVPISLTADVSDEKVFEDPVDPSKKFYLPRYRIVERNRQVQMSLVVNPQGWVLTIDFEKYPAPALEIAVRNAQEIQHEISVILKHHLLLGDANGGQKEWFFAPPVPNEGGFRAVLQVATQTELNLLFQVLTTPDYGAVVTVRRTVKVGVPVYTPNTSPGAIDGGIPNDGEIVSSGQGVLRGTWTFNLETGIEGDNNSDIWWEQHTDTQRSMVPRGQASLAYLGVANFDALSVQQLEKLTYSKTAINGSIDEPQNNQLFNGSVFAVLTNSGNYTKVQVLEYGYNLTIRWVTYRSPNPSEALVFDGKIVSSGQGVLRGTWTFNLETGIEGDNNSDIWWEQHTDTQRSMVPRGQASLAYLGVTNFDALSVQQLEKLTYSKTAINGSIDAAQNNQLFNKSVFAVLTNGGNYAKVQVLEYGYNLTIRWVTYRPPKPSKVLFREATRVLDNTLEPRPFVFPQALYPYIYQGVTGAGNQTLKPRRWSFVWQGRVYSYYQDPVKPQVIYYLPDCFKLVRRRESPHYPMVSIYFSPINDAAEEVRVTLEYWAFPFVDSERLKAAAQELGRAGVSGSLLFQPLVAGKPRLFLRLPQSDGSTRRQECADVPVELRTGFSDSLTFSRDNFKSIFHALFSKVTQLFQGEVTVDFPENPPEIIPFRARMDDLIGEAFDYTQAIDATTGSVQVTLKNGIESPIRINSLVSFFNDAEAQVPGTIGEFNPSLPAELLPEASLSCTIAPERAIAPESLSNLLFDLSDTKVLPDRDAIYYAILRPDSPTSYKRSIMLKIRKSVFGDRITDISIDFKQGGTVNISYEAFNQVSTDQLSVNATVLSPISNWILDKPDSGRYEFRTIVLLKDGSKIEDPPNQWRTDFVETLLLTSAELPLLPAA